MSRTGCDFGLREHHSDLYERIRRWIIAGGVLISWLLGVAVEIQQRVTALVIAFIAGGIILNVLKEELPGERRARLMPSSPVPCRTARC